MKNNVINDFKMAILVVVFGQLSFVVYKNLDENFEYFRFTHVWIDDLIFFIIVFLLVFLLVIVPRIYKFIIRILNSRRYDIILSIFLGVFFVILYNQSYANYAQMLVFLIFSLALMWGMLLYIYIFLGIKRGKSKFVSDEPEEKKDSLGIKSDAESFADSIYNNNSEKSFVFGIDAPWGIGKTSYLNFCKNYLIKNYGESVIIYDFKPISFNSSDDLFEGFIKDLQMHISENVYAPNINSGIYKYAKAISGIKVKFPLLEFGINNGQSMTDALENLKTELTIINKKIIIIIDDLDRLPIENVKIVLNIIRDSFRLPNISYIVCYDTENINSFQSNLRQRITKSYNKVILNKNEGDNKNHDNGADNISYSKEHIDNLKVVEYFEKIVQVKKTLVISRDKIKKCIGEFFKEVCFEGNTANQAINLIESEFLSNEKYVNYVHYIGDIRKIKRIVNIFILNNKLREINFNHYGLNPVEFFKLILVYINYPHIFRKIYIAETDGMGQFFSLKHNFKESTSNPFFNDDRYNEYRKEIGEKEGFLLDDIFNYKNIDQNKDNNRGYYYRAAHNGGITGGERKLEQYLKLLMENKLPDPFNADGIYKESITKVKEGENIINVLEGFKKEYQREKFLYLFWDEITNNKKFKKEYYDEYVEPLVSYIVENIKNYSMVDSWYHKYRGLRFYLIQYLADLIDKRGWHDENKENNNNINFDNLRGITDRIFGSNDSEINNVGILEKLSKESNGILGIYDMLLFRLICSRDRGDGLYNIYNALGYRATGYKYSREGDVFELTTIEMREISQKCFDIFKKRYIDAKKNIFEDGDLLTKDDIFGVFKSNVLESFVENKINSKEEFERMKSGILSFILYQLSSDKIDHGVGCGFFDESGNKNLKEIKEKMLKYLFEVCFIIDSDREKSIKNAKRFIYYLMISLTRFRDSFRPNIEEFKNMLDGRLLREYWNKNKDFIKNNVHKEESIKIYTSNYTASYVEDLEDLFKELDKL
ncbi:MAG: P-loop NTPase fold protein [Candidatus Moraniibacteriota bacterium]